MSVVLAPIDGSARALHAVPWAARLAGRDGTVVLFRAVPPEPDYIKAIFDFAGAGDASAQRIRDEWTAVAQGDLDEAAGLLESSNVTVERLIAEGEAEEAIVAAAERRGVDMIVMASHGRGAIGRAVFGSVADRVARTATVPVLILRTPTDDMPHDPVVVRRIVVPLDGSELAEEALPIAVTASRHLGAPIHIVRAVDPASSIPFAPGVLGPTPLVTSEVSDRIWREIEAEARQSVSQAVAKVQREGVAVDGATLTGSPFFAISDASEPGDLIVLTSHGRSGVGRWLLGSVAEKLVREAPAPVLLVPARERVEEARGQDEGGM
jgi:nucleotide-binding universal stress UspA family protein